MINWAGEGGESPSLILRGKNIRAVCISTVYLSRHDNHKILVTDLVFFEGFFIAEDFSWKETQKKKSRTVAACQRSRLSFCCWDEKATNVLKLKELEQISECYCTFMKQYHVEKLLKSQHNIPAYISFSPETGKWSFPFSSSILSFNVCTCTNITGRH